MYTINYTKKRKQMTDVEEYKLYKKTKRRILERKLLLHNFNNKGSVVYGFEEKFQNLYKKGIISEIGYAREKKNVKKKIKEHEDCIQLLRSQIKGMENSVQRFEDHVRTLLDELESRVGQKLPSHHPVLAWLVEYAVVLLNKYHLNAVTNRTAYHVVHGQEATEKSRTSARDYFSLCPSAAEAI